VGACAVYMDMDVEVSVEEERKRVRVGSRRCGRAIMGMGVD
jgi:hypothetical protein